MGKIDDRFFDILHACRTLSSEERRRIEDRPHRSANILEPLKGLHAGITEIVLAHHESWDGEGYPNRLAGEDIPLEAGLISVSDVFDALTQPRAYRGPLAIDEALGEIRKGAGSRFDPHVLERLDDPAVLDRWVEVVERGRARESRPSVPE